MVFRPSVRLTISVPRLFKRRPKNFPVCRVVDLGKKFAALFDFAQSVLEMKTPWLNHDCVSTQMCSSALTEPTDSAKAPKSQKIIRQNWRDAIHASFPFYNRELGYNGVNS